MRIPKGIFSVVMNPSLAIERLRAAGLTEQSIGSAVGARQSTINRIRRGLMQPTYEVGKALVDLAVTTERKAARRRRAAAQEEGGGRAA